MDKPKNVEHLIKLGQAAAEKQVKEDHFPQRVGRHHALWGGIHTDVQV